MNTPTQKKTNQEVLDAMTLSDPRLKLYTESQACAILGVSNVTLWKLRKSGQLKARRVLGGLRVSEADILDFLEKSQQRVVATA